MSCQGRDLWAWRVPERESESPKVPGGHDGEISQGRGQNKCQGEKEKGFGRVKPHRSLGVPEQAAAWQVRHSDEGSGHPAGAEYDTSSRRNGNGGYRPSEISGRRARSWVCLWGSWSTFGSGGRGVSRSLARSLRSP